MSKTIFSFLLIILVYVSGYAQSNSEQDSLFPLQKGNRWFYKCKSNYPEAPYGCIKEISSQINDSTFVIAIKYFYHDSVSNKTEYWSLKNGILSVKDTSADYYIAVFDSSMKENSGSLRFVYAEIFGRKDTVQQYYYTYNSPTFHKRDFRTVFPGIGIITTTNYAVDGNCISMEDSTILMGLVKNGVAVGDTIFELPPANRSEFPLELGRVFCYNILDYNTTERIVDSTQRIVAEIYPNGFRKIKNIKGTDEFWLFQDGRFYISTRPEIIDSPYYDETVHIYKKYDRFLYINWKIYKFNGDEYYSQMSRGCSGWQVANKIGLVYKGGSREEVFAGYKYFYTNLKYPSKNMIELPVSETFAWTKVSSDVKYRMQISTDSLFSGNIIMDETGIDTLIRVNSLSTATHYYWRVQTIFPDMEFWSETWSFTTAKTNIFLASLSEPANAAVNIAVNNTKLSWKVVPNVEKYRVQISNNSKFDSEIIKDISTSDTLIIVDSLQYSQKYYWRVQTTNNGFEYWSDVWSFSTIGPADYMLYQNYPNPFNPYTTIKYSIPQNGKVKLSLFDILGRQIKTLVNEEQPLGIYEVRFDGSGLASGVYFYIMEAGGYSASKKLLLMK